MANAVFYSNVAQQTTLSGSISSGATSINVGATTGFPPSTPYTLALDYGAATEELVSVTGVAGTTLTVTRAYGGTSAQSHGIGAVVRHVYDATDATAYRTHEAASSCVHGVTGSVVGTSDSQTLSNKTLTSPTVNGATMTGTIAGAHTYSGNLTFGGNITSSGAAMVGTFGGSPTFPGGPTFSGFLNSTGTIQSTQSASTNVSVASIVSGDGFDRFRSYASGLLEWGAGNIARDTNLYRSAANILQTDDSFAAAGTVSAAPTSTLLDGLQANLPTSTTGDLLNLRVNSAIQAAMDSSGAFRIYQGNAPLTYTPTWGNIGSATFNTNGGFYWRLGKLVFVIIYTTINVAGSGSGIVTVDMPSSVQRAHRQAITVNVETIGANGNATSASRGGECLFLTGGSGATADRLRVDNGTSNESNIQGVDLLAGGALTIQGWYREA